MTPSPGGGAPSARDRRDRLSRFLALVLRHRPDSVGIQLDPSGFVEVTTLAAALAAQPGWSWVTEEAIRDLARQDARRYEVADNHIRARYGHTVPIDTPGTPMVPPEWLYHGTVPESVPQIREVGLQHGERQFVHLSTTRQDALAVGRRRNPRATVVTVLARRASEAGIAFYQASVSLYLAREIPPQFLNLSDTVEPA